MRRAATILAVKEQVVSGTTENLVGTLEAIYLVVTGSTKELVGAVGSDENVVSGSTELGGRQRHPTGHNQHRRHHREQQDCASHP
jgi:hypothetical protein